MDPLLVTGFTATATFLIGLAIGYFWPVKAPVVHFFHTWIVEDWMEGMFEEDFLFTGTVSNIDARVELLKCAKERCTAQQAVYLTATSLRSVPMWWAQRQIRIAREKARK